MPTRAENAFRLLPSVEEVLGDPAVRALEGRVTRALLVRFVQEELEGLRAGVRAGSLDAEAVRRGTTALPAVLEERVRREEASGLRRAINATGVVLHTGLGRAPLHPEVARAMEEAAASYCVLEVERSSGRRGRRDARLGELLARLAGAEAGIAVNNNAGAVLLALNTFAAGRETVVSRGELVEIGGSFRMPDVMQRAGTRLVEVGTTNRTREEDFRAAAGEATGLLLKVHTSNFRLVGFTEEVSAAGLAALGAELGVATVYDLGSGRVEVPGTAPLEALGDEPVVADALASGVDVVTFSGDKLLGGPQAGLVVGRAAAVEAMRANPLYRALRLDKVALAGLESTLELYLAGRADEIPARAMLRAPAERLAERAAAIARALEALGAFEVHVEEDAAQAGSGSAPGVRLPGPVVRVRPRAGSTQELADRLRAAEPPVFARIQDDDLVLDPRTLLPGEDDELVGAFRSMVAGGGERA